ncbi:MAG: hypothetical protein MUD01_09490 [Chloroflexaceae bacterium]|nr:hypothetical protein [Chloroflexaceae bacterium]
MKIFTIHTPASSQLRSRRRSRFAITSNHVHRRALLRRMGLTCCPERPASLFNALAQSLLAFRVD